MKPLFLNDVSFLHGCFYFVSKRLTTMHWGVDFGNSPPNNKNVAVASGRATYREAHLVQTVFSQLKKDPRRLS